MDTRALLSSQYWTRPQILAYQEARVNDVVRRAVRIPFWKDRLDTEGVSRAQSDLSLTEFREIPIVAKKDFWKRDGDWGYYYDIARRASAYYEQTSGSTARPFGFYHDRSFELRSYGICERFFRTIGAGKRFPVISVRTRERRGFALVGYKLFHAKSASVLQHRVPQLVELIESFKQQVIIFGFSSWIAELARLVKESGMSLPLRAVIIAGEELSDTRREEIGRVLNTPVSMHYAMSELGRLAFECEHRHLHINEEWSYLEIVDESSAPVPDGVEGRIIVTPFDNPIMPLIRYDSGDRGTIGQNACSCGRTLRTLKLRGRQMHMLKFFDGRTISLLDVPVALDRYPTAIRQYQIIRTGDLSFTIRVIPGSQFEALKDQVAESLVRSVHPRLSVQWETAEVLIDGPNGKALYFIDQTELPYA